MKRIALFMMISFVGSNVEATGLFKALKAQRPGAPAPTSPVSVVVPSLDLGAIQQALAAINCKIGNVNQDVCQDTILSVLGDACDILGISISEALELLLECCGSDTVDLSSVFTVLQDIKDTITECCSTMTTDFQDTWTILADLSDTLTDCCATLEQDFQDTWTILDAINILIINDFNSTWTILSDIKDTITECCSTMTTNFQDTWTILTDLNDTLTDCCAQIQVDFQDTWTILADLKDTLTNCGMPTHITQAMIPYTITQPGLYCLAEDVTLSGTGIIIESDNVILDLNEHQMIGGVVGISVLSENNLIIKNGIVRDQSNANISVDTPTAITNLLIEQCQLLNATTNDLQVFATFRDIMVQDCIVISMLATGLKINPIGIETASRGLFIENCTIDAGRVGIDISPLATLNIVSIKTSVVQAGNNGINILGASNTSIAGCIVEQCVNGIFMTDGSEVRIDNCDIRSNSSTGIFSSIPVTVILNSVISGNGGDGVTLGSIIDNSLNSSVINCSIISNNGSGISISNAGPNMVKNCDIKGSLVNGITIGSPDTIVSNCSLIDNGITVNNTVSQITIENSVIESSLAQGISVTGGSNISIINCSILQSNSQGILISSGSNFIIANCYLNQTGSAGMQFASGVSRGVIRNCVIENAGLQGINVINGSFYSIENCTVNVAAAEGIVFQNGTTVGAIINCRVADCSASGINTHTTNMQILNCTSTQNLGNGFVTAGTSAEVINNVASLNNLNGFLNSGGATNKYYKNFATGNTAGNYSGVALVFTPATVLPGTFGQTIGNTDD